MTEQPAATTDKSPAQLHWWNDFWHFQPTVAKAVIKAPLLVAFLLVSQIAGLFNELTEQLMRVPDSLVFCAIACVVVNEAWSVLSGTPRKDHSVDYERIISVWGNSFLYGLLVLVGSLLLIGPGIYFLIVGSLGIVFVCVESMRAGQAFDASWKLIKGAFWPSLRYLAGAPLISISIVLASYFVTLALAFWINPNLDKMIVQVVAGPFGIAMEWILLCVLPPQVRLYKHLKENKAATAGGD